MTDREERQQSVLELQALAAAGASNGPEATEGGTSPVSAPGARAESPLYPPGQPRGARSLWTRSALGLLVAVAAALITFAVSSALPGTYRASTQLRITVNEASGLGQDSVLAGNQLAAQLVQLLPSDAVLSGPAAQLGMSTSKLRSTLSVGTVAQQNIVQIGETGSSSAQAEQRANAVTAGLLSFITRDASQQLRSYRQALSGVISGLDSQLSQLANARSKLTPLQIAVAQGEAGAIAGQALALRGQTAERTATSVPAVQVIQPASSASKVTPRPLLYAIVALLVVAFLAVQLIGMAERRSEAR